MDKNTKGIVAVIGVVLTLGVAYFIYKKVSQSKAEENNNPKDNPKPNEVQTLPVGSFPLKFADKNQKVYELQKLINKKYGLNIATDGKFGQDTASALCKHYFKTCFTDVQSRLYEVDEDDFNNLSK